jgi:hypothetical protein
MGGLTFVLGGALAAMPPVVFCALRMSRAFKALDWAALFSRLCVRAEVDFAFTGVTALVLVAAGVADEAGTLVALAVFAPPKDPNEDFAVPTLVALDCFAAPTSLFTGLGVASEGWCFAVEVDFPDENPLENLGSSLANEIAGSASRAIKMIFDVFMVFQPAKSGVSVSFAQYQSASAMSKFGRHDAGQSG